MVTWKCNKTHIKTKTDLQQLFCNSFITKSWNGNINIGVHVKEKLSQAIIFSFCYLSSSESQKVVDINWYEHLFQLWYMIYYDVIFFTTFKSKFWMRSINYVLILFTFISKPIPELHYFCFLFNSTSLNRLHLFKLLP